MNRAVAVGPVRQGIEGDCVDCTAIVEGRVVTAAAAPAVCDRPGFCRTEGVVQGGVVIGRADARDLGQYGF